LDLNSNPSTIAGPFFTNRTSSRKWQWHKTINIERSIT
jgi:hypothetical protein